MVYLPRSLRMVCPNYDRDIGSAHLGSLQAIGDECNAGP